MFTIESLVFDINEAFYYQFGVEGYYTELSLVLSIVLTPVLLYFLINNKTFMNYFNKTFIEKDALLFIFPTMFLVMVFSSGNYMFMLFTILVLIALYIFVTHPSYETLRGELIALIQKYL